MFDKLIDALEHLNETAFALEKELFKFEIANGGCFENKDFERIPPKKIGYEKPKQNNYKKIYYRCRDRC